MKRNAVPVDKCPHCFLKQYCERHKGTKKMQRPSDASGTFTKLYDEVVTKKLERFQAKVEDEKHKQNKMRFWQEQLEKRAVGHADPMKPPERSAVDKKDKKKKSKKKKGKKRHRDSSSDESSSSSDSSDSESDSGSSSSSSSEDERVKTKEKKKRKRKSEKKSGAIDDDEAKQGKKKRKKSRSKKRDRSSSGDDSDVPIQKKRRL